MRRHRVGAEIVLALLDDAIVRGDDRAAGGSIDCGMRLQSTIRPTRARRPAGDRQPAVAAGGAEPSAHAIADRARIVSGDEIVVDRPPRASLRRALRPFRPASWEAGVEGTISSANCIERSARPALAADRRDHRAGAASRSPRTVASSPLHDDLLAPPRHRLPRP